MHAIIRKVKTGAPYSQLFTISYLSEEWKEAYRIIKVLYTESHYQLVNYF